MTSQFDIDTTDCGQGSCAPCIVGYACRLPGAGSADAAWSVLAGQHCTIGKVDTRFFDPDLYFDPRPGVRGKAYSFAAGQMDGILQFDVEAFGISPREAAQMDPQQRVLLRTVWEALEHAGLRCEDLRGDRTGVFVGASIVENLSLHYYDPARGDSPTALGNELSIIANRISAQFDFGGPSLVIDTACSSGLSALHNASEALRRGEIDTAVVGAVHAVRTPGGFVAFSQARMLSPTGLCRAFDAKADGYVRSDGCVVFILQRPEVAVRLLARVRGRILASGVNTDARASPLAVPSSDRQAALIDRVLEQSGTDPDDLAFYEAHGTGTQVGDLAEAAALGQAIGRLRCEPLSIGSAKTNFGHLEPVAGLVGCLKAVMALENETLPASLHFQTPNPDIDFDGLNLVVSTVTQPLERSAEPRRCGVSSFGFGGTNAVAILEGPARSSGLSRPKLRTPKRAASDEPCAPPWLLLSAASDRSLKHLSRDWASLLDQSDRADWCDLAAAVAGTRSALQKRRAVLLTDDAPDRLRGGGEAGGENDLEGVCTPSPSARTVLAFPGNGAQFAGMGRHHYRTEPDFRESFERSAEVFAAQGFDDLAALIFRDDLDTCLRNPIVAQPLLFACQVALADGLARAGLKFDAVIGHSMGEISALTVAGVLDRQAAARVILSRSRAMESLLGAGTMAVLAASEEDANRALAGFAKNELEIAAINGPRSVAVSGSKDAIDRLARVTVHGRRLALVRLDLEVPYHSAALDPLKAVLTDDLSDLRVGASDMVIASGTLGRVIRHSACTGEFFWRNARDPVRFADAVRDLAATGPLRILEVAHREVLGRDLRDLARLEGLPITHLPVAPDHKREEPLRHTVARAWTRGLTVCTEKLAGRQTAPSPKLPAYPWDEKEYHAPLSPDGFDIWGENTARSLAGRRPDRQLSDWVAEFSPAHPAWVADHRVGETCVLPATVLAEIALSAGAEIWPDSPLELLDFEILVPAAIDDQGQRISTRIDEPTGAVTLQMRPRLTEQPWDLLARGTLRPTRVAPLPTPKPGHGRRVDADTVYQILEDAGLHYGDPFRRLRFVRHQRRKVWVHLDPASRPPDGFVLDPMSLDACFHGLAALKTSQAGQGDRAKCDRTGAGADAGNILMPTRFGHLTVWNPGRVPHKAVLEVGRTGARTLSVDLRLFDESGRAVADLRGAEFTRAQAGAPEPVALGAWAWRRVRLRRDAEPVGLPAAWRTPAVALKKLGLVAERPQPEIANHVNAFRSMLRSGDRRGMDHALGRCLKSAPDLADDLRHQMAVARGQPAWDLLEHSWMNRQQWRLAEQIVRALAGNWNKKERLNLLLMGLPDLSLVQRLARHERIDRLRLGHPDPNAVEFLRSRLPDTLKPMLETAATAGSHDLIVASGCADRPDGPQALEGLCSGGLLVEIDAPDLPVAEDYAPHERALYFPGRAEDLPLRVIARRSTGRAVLRHQPKRRTYAAFGPTPRLPGWAQALESLVANAGDTPDTLLLSHVHQPGDDITEVLTRRLLDLRRFLQQSRPKLVLLCLENGPSRGFRVLSAGLAAAVRTVRNEAPERDISLVCVHDCTDAANDPLDAAYWHDLLGRAESEQLLVQDKTGLWTERLRRVEDGRQTPGPQCLTRSNRRRDGLVAWTPTRVSRPKSGEVEIAVDAAGLNFRDVMLARGLLPERMVHHGALGLGLGIECAGKVLRGGPETELQPGTPVMALTGGAFSSRLILPEQALTVLPPNLSPDVAAGTPVVFATAWEALVGVARLQPAERVLIHGGAGGVGLAAIQIARMLGAEVYATAGTEEKRAIARGFGAAEAFCSRDLSFADAVLDRTEGQGVDVVLNCLSGAATQRSLECLAPFGRFVEIGKRDFAEGNCLNLRPFASNLLYHALDLDQLAARSPQRISRTIANVRDRLAAGDLQPLPTTVFEADATADALHRVFAARHVGKVVLKPPVPGKRPRVRKVRDDWIVIGGTGGIGLALAEFLLEEGAREVHLVSRSGALPPDLHRSGAWIFSDPRVTLHAADGTDRNAMAALLNALSARERRIGGVIHAAMVMRDRLVKDLDPLETEMVVASKLRSAEVLDDVIRQTACEPDHVIFLSSVASVLGNPGQIAYCAANAALEALADDRRRDGLNGTVLGLGAVGDVGFLTRRTPLRMQLSKINGFDLMTIGDVLEHLRSVLQHPPDRNVYIARVDWEAMATTLPALAGPGFSDLVSRDALERCPATELVDRVRQADWRAAVDIVESEVRGIAARVMRLPNAEVDLTRPLGSYGIDSLMAMELRLEIEQRFGRLLSPSLITAEFSARSLAASLTSTLRADATPRDAVSA